LKIERVNLKEVIDESIEKMKYFEAFQHLDIKVSIKEESPLYSDTYRLSVIFNNLISNAIKYLDETKQKSYFKIECIVEAEKAKLIFEDNGIGIDKALLPKIFNMFFRATETKEGSGLGLYIVKEAVDLLQGKIEIQSEFGRGTKFTMEVPNFTPSNDEKKELKKTVAVK
jgi:signal transduction histidine kinase